MTSIRPPERHWDQDRDDPSPKTGSADPSSHPHKLSSLCPIISFLLAPHPRASGEHEPKEGNAVSKDAEKAPDPALHPIPTRRPDRAAEPGGAGRDRTGDFLLAKQALSHLSYSPEGREAPDRNWWA